MSILYQNLEPFQKEFVNNTLEQYKKDNLRNLPYRIFLACLFVGLLCQFLELTSEKVSGLVDFAIYLYTIMVVIANFLGIVFFHAATSLIENCMYSSCQDPNRHVAHTAAKQLLIFERPKTIFQYCSDMLCEILEIGIIILLVLQGWKLAAVIMIGVYITGLLAKKKIHGLNLLYVDSLTPEIISDLENPEKSTCNLE